MKVLLTFLLAALGCTNAAPPPPPADPLPSWQAGPVRDAIVEFVAEAARQGAPGFIAPAERIAVFDNDGTLWSEQPMYFQVFFMVDRIKALAAEHPEWQKKEPYASVLRGDIGKALAGGEHAIVEMIMATHSGMTSEEFAGIVRDWIATARHPKSGQPFTKMVYQPMLELLAYLSANGFRTFIVSGGGIEFMRPWTEEVYGIPADQVVGSSGKLALEVRDGQPVVVKLPGIDFIDDKAGKPVGIQRHIGRRPVFTFGNSDGDLEMLQWTAAGSGPRFMGLVHHTDGEREVAYDRESHIGRLDKALDEATSRGWTIVDMKRDWKAVYPPE